MAVKWYADTARGSVFSNGGLTAARSGTGSAAAIADTGVGPGQKLYWEIVFTGDGDTFTDNGKVRPGGAMSNFPISEPGGYLGGGPNFGVLAVGAVVRNNTAPGDKNNNPYTYVRWASGDVLRFALDYDGGNLFFAVNGNAFTAALGLPTSFSGNFYPAFELDDSATNATVTGHFTATSFVYPPRAGFDALDQTVGRLLLASAGALTIGGKPAAMLQGHMLPAAPAAMTLTGGAAQPRVAKVTLAASGALTMTGRAASLLHGFSLPLGVGSLVLAGRAATLRRTRLLAAQPALVSSTGRTVGLLFGFSFAMSPGAIMVAGQAAQVRSSRRINAATGSVGLTGIAAALTRIGVRILSADRAALALVGRAAGLLFGHSLTVSAGTVPLVGKPAIVRSSRRIDAAVGSVVLTGIAAGLNRVGVRAIAASAASFMLSGATATTRLQRRLVADGGQMLATGRAALVRARRQLVAGGAACALVGRAALFRIEGGRGLTDSQMPTRRFTARTIAAFRAPSKGATFR